jgi:PAS domain S-box-containing protein
VHSERQTAEKLLKTANVVASVAPSFAASFGIKDFTVMKIALGKLGFFDAQETAVGARAVTSEYKRLLEGKKFKNFITSACPAVNYMIQMYYPKALPYLAPVDSPMIAHAKIIKGERDDVKVVFIGPCIAKKKEAAENGIIDCVLTFEDIRAMFNERNIVLEDIARVSIGLRTEGCGNAKYYPISRGIIKSFDECPSGYEYVAVDGNAKCCEVLDNIESLSGMFLELSCCEYSCVNGPCALEIKGGAVKANGNIREYVAMEGLKERVKTGASVVNLERVYRRLHADGSAPSERDLREILEKTGKKTKDDELNCGACGYNTCREKAWAVFNGYAATEMCLPYMRERAESMSYEIIQNSPNGIILLDEEFKITEINNKAVEMLGTDGRFELKGRAVFEFLDPTDFVVAANEGVNIYNKKMYIDKTEKYAELTVVILKSQKLLFGVMKDITDETQSANRLNALKLETLTTTDGVIKKQMRVAQEIASLLGETTAETKLALLKLKRTISEN